ncbi:CaiB/BaiF CoA-transferase family protein [Mycobacterium sp. EPa45]|uniref:CaiB/BaiF CoA transferase family protein n=1 Tax=Mycobacterium sp. EPa45 TaxID=1545728 RepID=UPI000641DFC1|nr:CoA transferase [Mycobacterium sp. EPa45]AKK30121.1 CoA-transferase [Mycobacterium sp. EPa45]
MTGFLTGIRVLEVASFGFVPAAGAVLADWGADVVKIEHPLTGDPMRGMLSVTAMGVDTQPEVNFLVEQVNRGKRSVGLDVANPRGRRLLNRLIQSSDVLLTNMLPGARKRLGIDVDEVRECNPRIIYARGHGQGSQGPDADVGGFDTTSFWARSGIAEVLRTDPDGWPAPHRAGIGDMPSGMMLAGGIAAALLGRERTGAVPTVDVSLLNCAMWTIGFDIIGGQHLDEVLRFPREEAPNPLANNYRTADGRIIILGMFQSDRFWKPFCEGVGRGELVEDPRFHDSSSRYTNRRECIAQLDDVFAARTLDEWKTFFAGTDFLWSVYQVPQELFDDPQVVANGYLPSVQSGSGTPFTLVANPVQFDERPAELVRAPEHGQHTEEVLLELGLTWDELEDEKTAGAIL